MPYTFKGPKSCEKSDGSKGNYYTKKKGKSGRCYDSEDAYIRSMAAGYAGNAHDDNEGETIMEIRNLLSQLIYEHACACEEQGIELPIPGVAYPIEIEEIIVDPVSDAVSHQLPAVEIDIMPDAVDPILDTIEDVFVDEEMMSYPYTHHEDNGRMFDYGHTKSDSHEGRMTRAKLYRMGKMAQSFHDRLEDGDDLPEWVQDKVTTAEDRLRSAYEYIEYKLHRMNQQGTMCNETTVRKLVRNYLRS